MSEQSKESLQILDRQSEFRSLRDGSGPFEFLKQTVRDKNGVRGFVATNMGTSSIMGLVGFCFYADGEVELGPPGPQLRVEEQMRNRGLGTTLSQIAIEYIKEIARKYNKPLKSIFLSIYPNNTYALKIAESFGFKENQESEQKTVLVYRLPVSYRKRGRI